MSEKIFTITVVNGDPELAIVTNSEKLRSRCWGYYFNREDAEHVIENNETDISEQGYYQFGVLAELGEGPCADIEELQWYEFIWKYDVEPQAHDTSKEPDRPQFVEAKKIKKPKKYEHYMFGGL